MVHDTLPSRNDIRYLVDSDWAIDHMHQRERVVNRVRELAPFGLGISIVSLGELYEGEFNSTDPETEARTLRTFLNGVVGAVWVAHSQIRENVAARARRSI